MNLHTLIGCHDYASAAIKVNLLGKSIKQCSDEEIISLIIHNITKYCHQNWDNISSTSREIDLAYCRHIFCFFTMHLTDYSYQRIGALVNRDHSTVVNSIKTYRSLIDPQFGNLRFQMFAFHVRDKIYSQLKIQ